MSFEPKIIAFLCNWCSYAGADLAGVSRSKCSPNVMSIRLMCSGGLEPAFVLKAFREGADGVLIGGCHPGDCHYISGNLAARRKFALLKSMLQYAGIEPERVQFSWVSASEGGRFASIVEKVVEQARALGPNKKLVKSL